MKKPVIIALVLGALVLAACGQKSGVHLASGRNGALVNPDTGEVIGGSGNQATGTGENAAAAGGGPGGGGAAGGATSAAAGGASGAAARTGGGATGGGT